MARRSLISKEERERNCRKSGLLEDHQYLKKITPAVLKAEIVDDLLDRFTDNYQITRDEVRATIEMLGRPWVLLKAIKRGNILSDVMNIAKTLPAGTDVTEKFPDDVKAVEKYVADLINLKDPKIASELIQLIAPNYDFSAVIKESINQASRLRIQGLPGKIREVFAEVFN